jgi:hypothetical protein
VQFDVSYPGGDWARLNKELIRGEQPHNPCLLSWRAASSLPVNRTRSTTMRNMQGYQQN